MNSLALPSLLLVGTLVACGGSGQPPKDADAVSPAASSTATSDVTAPSTAAGGASASSTAGEPTAATSSSRAPIESAVRPKTTSTGGTYGLGAIEATGLEKDDVVRALGAVSAKTDECYGRLFKKHLNAVGKTSFDVTVDGKGKTQTVTKKADDLGDADLPKCLEGALRKVAWSKPADKKGAKISLEWVVAGN